MFCCPDHLGETCPIREAGSSSSARTGVASLAPDGSKESWCRGPGSFEQLLPIILFSSSNSRLEFGFGSYVHYLTVSEPYLLLPMLMKSKTKSLGTWGTSCFSDLEMHLPTPPESPDLDQHKEERIIHPAPLLCCFFFFFFLSPGLAEAYSLSSRENGWAEIRSSSVVMCTQIMHLLGSLPIWVYSERALSDK